MIEYQTIIDKINLTNNGKLLVCRFTKAEKVVLDEMRGKGIIAPALFCGQAAAKLSERFKDGFVQL